MQVPHSADSLQPLSVLDQARPTRAGRAQLNSKQVGQAFHRSRVPGYNIRAVPSSLRGRQSLRYTYAPNKRSAIIPQEVPDNEQR